jgi:tRNA pseudouridine65 synthase/23S rRNA pseudouridine1911/1915/1917 synthase
MTDRPAIAAYEVAPEDPTWRIDRMASERLGIASRSRAKKLVKAGDILLNGMLCESSRILHPGDRLVLLLPLEPPPIFELPLELVFCDPHLAAIDKPAGLVVSGNRHRTVEHALLFNLPPSEAPDALPYPRPVHRLDARTSGLLLVARSASAQIALGRAFQDREVHKRYRTIVVGKLEGAGIVEDQVDGKVARSRWEAVEHTRSLHVDWLTTVDVWPETGRKHQIRVHLAGLGHPVLGDGRYTTGRVLRSQGLFLFAAELRLTHPITAEPLHLELPEPVKYGTFRNREARRWARHDL